MNEEFSHTQNPYESPFYSSKVAAVLERDLGLGKKQACLLLLPGNHVITPESLAVLTQADMVGGEFDKDDLVYFLSQDPPLLPTVVQDGERKRRFRFPGVGGNPDELLYHHRAVRKLVRDGITLFTSDGPTSQVYVDYDEAPLHLRTMLGMWQLGSLVGSGVLASGVALKAHMDRRRFLSLALGAAGGVALYTGTKGILDWYNSLDDPRKIPLGRNEVVERVYQQQEVFERVKEKLGLEQNIFETYTGSLVGVRNASIALNSLHSLATSVGKSRLAPLVMALLYGNGHGEIENLLEGGVDDIELAVDKFATSLLTESLDLLITIYDEEYSVDLGGKPSSFEQEDRVNYSIATHLNSYSNLFPDPNKIGGPQWLEDNLAASRIPPTARTVLLDRAREHIAELRTIDTPESIRKARILSKLVRLIVSDVLSERRVLALTELQFSGSYPMEKKVGKIEDYAEVEAKILLGDAQFSEAEQKAREDTSFIYVNYDGSTIPSGVIKYHGAYNPVYRGYGYDEVQDKVVAADMALLQRNQYVALPRREYRRTNSIPRLAEGDLLVRIRLAKNGQSSIYLVDPLRDQQISRPNDIYFEGGVARETDPLKVGAVELELVG